MDLFNYVALSLQTRQSVGVEGLGTFHNEYIPGAFDESQQSFLPPRIQTAFSLEVTDPEDLFQFLSEKKGMTMQETQEWVKNDVLKVFKDLDFSGKCNLYPLGYLKKNNQELVFESLLEEHSSNHTFFGLPTLNADDDVLQLTERRDIEPEQIPEVQPSFNTEFVQPTSTVTQVAEIFKDKLNNEDDLLIVAIETDEDSDLDKSRVSSLKVVKAILLFLLIAVIVFAVYVWFKKPQWSQKWLPAIEEKKDTNKLLLDEEILADSMEHQSELWADSNLVDTLNNDSSALKLKEQANKYLETPPTIVDTFQVIVASFPNRNAALNQLKAYKNKGYDAEIAHGAKGVRTKIAIGTFTDLDSAENQQRKMQKNGFKEAWILIKKAN